MTEKLQELHIPDTEFNWDTWNCYHLVSHVRNQLGLKQLPDFSSVIKTSSEKIFDTHKIIFWLDLYAQQTYEFEDGCLVCLNFMYTNVGLIEDSVYRLGVYHGGNIYFMSTQAVIFPPKLVAQYLHSIWSY